LKPRPPAPHVQAALLRAAQAKLPDRLPAAPAPHVRNALAAAQAKQPPAPPGRHQAPQAPHVRQALHAAQAKLPAPATQAAQAAQAANARQAAPPVAGIQGRPGPVLQRRKVQVPGLGEIDTEDYTEDELYALIPRHLMADGSSGALAVLNAALDANEFRKERERKVEAPPDRRASLRPRPRREESAAAAGDGDEAKEGSRFRAGSNPLWAYPAQPPERLRANRSGFSRSETDELLDPSRFEEASPYAEVTRFSLYENKGSGIGTLRLGISYNHILADSRIRSFYKTALQRVQSLGPSTQAGAAISAAMTNLFAALTGGDRDLLATATRDWERLSASGRAHDMSIARASRVVSNAAGNVRPGHARTNTDIGNAFDPELDHRGHFTARTIRIYDAVLGLARAGAISPEGAMDALRPPTPRSDAMSGFSSTGSGSSHSFQRPESREEMEGPRRDRRRDDRGRSAPRSFPPGESALLPPRRRGGGGRKRKRS
jgi:hypothetical protein